MPDNESDGVAELTHDLQPIKCVCNCHLYADKNGELLMSHVAACCCVHGYMADCLTCEMERRTTRDGIPRYITADGNIMKYDWELVSDAVYDQDALEEHVERLIAAAKQEENRDAANSADDTESQ